MVGGDDENVRSFLALQGEAVGGGRQLQPLVATHHLPITSSRRRRWTTTSETSCLTKIKKASSWKATGSNASPL